MTAGLAAIEVEAERPLEQLRPAAPGDGPRHLPLPGAVTFWDRLLVAAFKGGTDDDLVAEAFTQELYSRG